MSAPERDRSVRIVKSIGAPAEKVFAAFVEPDRLVDWIGPGGPGATRVEIHPDTGTTDVWVDRDEGEKHQFHWEVVESNPHSRLVLDFAFGGPAGSPLPDERSRLTLEIEEVGLDSSELTLTHELLTPEQAEGVDSGWRTITDRLARTLERKVSK